jgi:hypothetical protein
VLVPLSSHTHSEITAESPSFDTQTNGRHALREQPDDDLATLRNPAAPTRSLKQALLATEDGMTWHDVIGFPTDNVRG